MRGRDGVRARARDRVGARRDALGSSRRACLVPALALLCVLAAPPTAIAQYPAAEAYVAKATVSPSSADRTYGAAVAADDGRVATLIGLGSVEVTHFASADATAADAERATLALDDDDVSATGLEDVVGASPRLLAMRDGLVVLGAPGRGGGAGGARVWRLDTSDTKPNENTWNSTSFVDLGSSDGARNKVGVSAATAGRRGDCARRALRRRMEGRGVRVFRRRRRRRRRRRVHDGAHQDHRADTRGGGRFGASVEVSHGVVGPGNGWLVVAAPGADAGAGAVFCYARVPLSGPAGTPAFGYARAQKLTSAAATYGGVTIDSGFGAGVALTGRFLLATRAPSVGRAGHGETLGDANVFLLARSSAAPSRLTRRART